MRSAQCRLQTEEEQQRQRRQRLWWQRGQRGQAEWRQAQMIERRERGPEQRKRQAQRQEQSVEAAAGQAVLRAHMHAKRTNAKI